MSQCHCSLVELLVSLGADINVEDEDGDTGLHLAVMRQTNKNDISLTDAPAIANVSYHPLVMKQFLYKYRETI